MSCPSRDKVKRKFWIFEWEEGQPHDWKPYVSWRSFWWNIRWVCIHCEAQYEEWPIYDLEMMKKLNLKKCPPHNSFGLSMNEKDLEEYK
jgi:hypothetical protein